MIRLLLLVGVVLLVLLWVTGHKRFRQKLLLVGLLALLAALFYLAAGGEPPGLSYAPPSFERGGEITPGRVGP